MKQHKKVLKKPVLAIALAAILLVSVLTVSLVVSGKGRTAEDPISGNGRSENYPSESSMSAENVWKDNGATEGPKMIFWKWPGIRYWKMMHGWPR